MEMSNKGIPLVRTDCIHDLAELFNDEDINVHSLISSVKAPVDIQRCEFPFIPETVLLNIITMFGERVSRDTFVTRVWLICKNVYIPSVIAQLDKTRGGTVKEALEEFCEIIRYYSSGVTISLKLHNDCYWLVREKEGTTENWFKYAEIFSVIFMDELITALTKNNCKEKYVTIVSSDTECFFECSRLAHVQFFTLRSVTGIRLNGDLLNQKVFLFNKSEKKPVREVIPSDFLCSFKHAMQPYLSLGKLPISKVANILEMSPRTIQRRLYDAGVTYREVLEDILLNEAQLRLERSTDSITSIATRIGYGESANFTRFFKRKTGLTPSQFRSLHQCL
ncbi:helix-turn-helix transcriptional regulator [Vibrio gigantis]|uniref:helix-turn-helix transcriptional regulator n=1 Tax=Vibrio gigantis TaxID=296199 RepID=UPI001BFDFFA5|nr:helix-turn-helix transcriptional regulator [Vibrio gigantis]ULN65905.1 helix-turn-helix transcriptional regulator [Vibrio gigantis]